MIVHSLLETIIALAAIPDAVLTHTDVAAWPEAVLRLFERNHLIRATSDATWIRCPECSDGHSAEVIERSLPKGRSGYAITCPEAGLVPIDALLLRQWRVDPEALATAMAVAYGMQRAVETLVPGQAWRLGSAILEDQLYAVVLIRGLKALDGVAGVSPAKTVALVLGEEQSPGTSFAAVIPLKSVLRLQGQTLTIDQERIATAVGGDDEFGDKPVVDVETRTITYRGKSCKFSSRAGKLFSFFARLNRHPGRGVSFDILRSTNEVFDGYSVADDSIRSAMKRLRTRLELAKMNRLANCLKTDTRDRQAYAVLDLSAYDSNSH